MRILIISYHFPPFNAIGAIRVSKTAKYLAEFGHEVYVVTARKQRGQPNLELEIEAENVVYAGRSPFPWAKLERRLSSLGNWGVTWYPYALHAAKKLMRKWRPDLIYASAMPYNSLLSAFKLSKGTRIPWVAELRDLWMDNHYRIRKGLRGALQQRLERKVLSSASGLVTVSEPLARKLREKYTKPVAVVLNGFDPADYPCEEFRTHVGDGSLRIIYTGDLYGGKRDPSPLFRAIKSMGREADGISVIFCGTKPEIVNEIAKQAGIPKHVEVRAPVPYKESLRLQTQADLLLLLLWNDPQEYGVYTGKLFEYIGARRPILVIGPRNNVAVELIKERGLGFTSNEPDEIVKKLRYWQAQKAEQGCIPSLPTATTNGLTRQKQTRVLESFLNSIDQAAKRSKSSKRS